MSDARCPKCETVLDVRCPSCDCDGAKDVISDVKKLLSKCETLLETVKLAAIDVHTASAIAVEARDKSEQSASEASSSCRQAQQARNAADVFTRVIMDDSIKAHGHAIDAKINAELGSSWVGKSLEQVSHAYEYASMAKVAQQSAKASADLVKEQNESHTRKIRMLLQQTDPSASAAGLAQDFLRPPEAASMPTASTVASPDVMRGVWANSRNRSRSPSRGNR